MTGRALSKAAFAPALAEGPVGTAVLLWRDFLCIQTFISLPHFSGPDLWDLNIDLLQAWGKEKKNHHLILADFTFPSGASVG